MSQHRFANGAVLVDCYEIKHYHLAGGMQEVYVCFDHSLSRHVVLKTPKEGIQDRRFRRGAEMGARVNHPNVAATFDYFEDDNVTFMIEEYIVGSDLGRRLANDFVFFDPSLAAHIIHHIARALHEAHRVGICHRDLKPSNIMTSDDASLSVIKLTDFGIAKLAESEIAVEMERFEDDESTLTSSNTLLGAVPYMAPECWADWKAAGKPMDIWALGCVGYQLLTGDAPFGTGRQAIANVIRAEQFGTVDIKKPSWFGRHPSTAPLENELWNILQSCIKVDPSSRATAEAVITACDDLCYAAAPRRKGIVQQFGMRYPDGGKARTGNIKDSETNEYWFFHGSDFFGAEGPTAGQCVNFSVYPGEPKARSAPVLLLR